MGTEADRIPVIVIQPRLYLDEDSMRRSLTFGLRARNVDVVTALEAGMVNRPDEDHLAVATGQGRVIYSFNVADYCVLHQEWITRGQHHAGIIVAQQQRYSIGEEIRRLMRLLSAVPANEMRNRIEFLSTWG